MDFSSFKPKNKYPPTPLTEIEKWRRNAWLDIPSHHLKEILEKEPLTAEKIRDFLLEKVDTVRYIDDTSAIIAPSHTSAGKWDIILGLEGPIEDIGKRLIHEALHGITRCKGDGVKYHPTFDETVQEIFIETDTTRIYNRYSQSIDLIATRILQGRFFDRGDCEAL